LIPPSKIASGIKVNSNISIIVYNISLYFLSDNNKIRKTAGNSFIEIDIAKNKRLRRIFPLLYKTTKRHKKIKTNIS
jgi:hypothetical protein